MKKKIKALSKRTAVAGLILNLILPGLGTIILGKYDIGTIQVILSLIGLFFSISLIGVMIGFPIFLATWIWALFVSIKTLKKAVQR